MRSHGTLLYGSELGPKRQNAAWTLSICDASDQAHPRRQVARPYHQQWDTVTSWYPQHALLSQQAPPEMARTCSSHGWWTHPQGSFIRAIENRSQESRACRPRFMEANKRDLKTCEIDPSNWDDAVSERARWRRTVKKGIGNADVKPCFTICSRILLSRKVAWNGSERKQNRRTVFFFSPHLSLISCLMSLVSPLLSTLLLNFSVSHVSRFSLFRL